MAFTSQRTKIELLHPIDGSVLVDITTKGRSANVSRRPTYASRGYHRSAAVTAARLRTQGTVTLQLNADDLALLRELERWQKGVVWYPMRADLRGRRYRQPDLRITVLDAQGAVEEVVTAYGVKLSDESLDLGMGPAKESIALDVLGGFDTPSDTYEPVRALDFHRTGPATYIGLDGAMHTAQDGEARIGLPWVVRRNLYDNSGDLLSSYWVKTRISVTAGQLDPFGGRGAFAFVEDTGAGGHYLAKGLAGLAFGTYTVSAFFKANERNFAYLVLFDGAASSFAYFDLSTGTIGAFSAPSGTNPTITNVGNGWYRCTVTLAYTSGTLSFQSNIATANGTNSYTGNGASGILAYGPMLNTGTTALPYQPTNASGVDLTHPLNGAGLVLEGAETNLCPDSETIGGVGWGIDSSGTVLVSSTQPAPNGTNTASQLTGSGGGNSYTYDIFQSADGAWYTFSVWLRGSGQVGISFQGNGGSFPIYASKQAIELTNDWRRYSLTVQKPSDGLTTTRIVISQMQNTDTVYAWGAQVENNPFVTSYIRTQGGVATRQPDKVGIVPPHNLLRWSEGFTNPAWQKFNGLISATGVLGPDGLMNATTFNATSTGSPHLRQELALASGKAYCPAIWVRRNSGTGDIVADLGDGAAITRTLSTSWQRLEFPTTKGAQSWLDFRFTATGTYDICKASLVEGNHPGIYVPTTDTPIPAPVSPALDPAWSQNGRMRIRILPPPISTGKHVAYLGAFDGISSTYQEARLALARASSQGLTGYQLIFERRHSGGSQVRGALFPNVQAFWDGAPHDVILEWTNEVNEATGVREMWQRLYIDGVKVAEQDVAALYGATAWAEIDPSRLISDGNVFAVISQLELQYPTPRAGYRQVT